MKKRRVHKNLNTSFINLSALIRQLQQQKFIGVVHLETNEYEADVFINGENKPEARERDIRAGRVSAGEEVLERLLIRAREPGGNVTVYEKIEEEKASPFKSPIPKPAGQPPLKSPIPKPYGKPPETRRDRPPAEKPLKEKTASPSPEKPPEAKTAPLKKQPEEKSPEPRPRPHVAPAIPVVESPPVIERPPQKPVPRKPAVSLKSNPITMGQTPAKPLEMLEIAPEEPAEQPKSAFTTLKEKLGLGSLPFSFTNRVEKKARQTARSSEEDWEDLLDLTGELLGTTEKCLNRSNLNFAWVFDKARVEICTDYPFLHPHTEIFEYENGKVYMSEQVKPQLFVAGIAESLRHILDKLEAYPKFDEVRELTIENIRELMNKHRDQYDKFSLTLPVKRVIGI